MSSIGNPQNLLVAINGNVPNVFITFLHYLALPTIINLFIVFMVIKIFYRKELRQEEKIFIPCEVHY